MVFRKVSRAEFAGDDATRGVFPSIVGRPRHTSVIAKMGVRRMPMSEMRLSQREVFSH